MVGYRLIKGQFRLFYQGQTRVVRSQPDGDSLWFEPHDPRLLSGLGGRKATPNKGGLYQLRFEAIDALELHYKGSHQAMRHAVAPRDSLLESIGFGKIEYAGSKQMSVRSAQHHPVPGYILTRGVDPHGRPITFVFAGRQKAQDGSRVWVGDSDIDGSLNAELVRKGLVYPMHYSSLPVDLREAMLRLLANARAGTGRGLWPDDASTRGFTVNTIQQLEKHSVWPKLYRRLLDYFRGGAQDLARFQKWLTASGEDRDDELVVLPKRTICRLHDVVQVTGNRVKMAEDPHDLVVVPG